MVNLDAVVADGLKGLHRSISRMTELFSLLASKLTTSFVHGHHTAIMSIISIQYFISHNPQLMRFSYLLTN